MIQIKTLIKVIKIEVHPPIKPDVKKLNKKTRYIQKIQIPYSIIVRYTNSWRAVYRPSFRDKSYNEYTLELFNEHSNFIGYIYDTKLVLLYNLEDNFITDHEFLNYLTNKKEEPNEIRQTSLVLSIITTFILGLSLGTLLSYLFS